jgi:hypothetical protein
MGLLTPVILGVLGREQNGPIRAGGLARMLTEQKDLIGAAMPAGLGKLSRRVVSATASGRCSPPRRTEQICAAYDQREQAT